MGIDNFTQSAKTFWNNIPPDIQERLLDNVYCTQCRKMTTITNYTGRIECGDLILEGFCIRCGGSVSRLIEGDEK
ncbi:MAG: hypothetical protein EH225_09770 [Calditrichaeota bacterium]|nr:MAG: hypothetical protein EH225_09770 [Calditrichota bacterium]